MFRDEILLNKANDTCLFKHILMSTTYFGEFLAVLPDVFIDVTHIYRRL